MKASNPRRIWQVAAVTSAIAACVLVWPARTVRVAAQSFSSGSTGADGPLEPTCTGCIVNVDLPPDGILNYTTINIGSSVTVVFRRNAANTPAVILASGDVSISGVVDVIGGSANGGIPGRGGPGGFDGGLGGVGFGSSPDGTPGGGPGGGQGGVLGVGTFPGSGSGGGYGTAGGANGAAVPGGSTYGVSTLFPLVGGSGGGGGAGGAVSSGPAGGGGGGAILIASSGKITMMTQFVQRGIYARGGNGVTKNVTGTANTSSACGSGGAIRLIANTIESNGAQLDVRGTACNTVVGGYGRIRLEAFQISGTLNPLGATTVSQSLPGPIVPTAATSAVRIMSIGGVNVPPSPQASYFVPPDVIVSPSASNPIPVVLQGRNIPVGTVINVTVITEGVATRTVFGSTPLTGTLATSSATANVTLPPGTSILTASATFAQ